MARLDTLFTTDEPSTMGEFVLGWVRSRPYQLFLKAIPAFLLALPLMVVVLGLPLVNKDRLGRRYHRAAVDAWQEQQPQQAQLFFAKAQSLLPKIPEVQFSHAMLAYENEDVQSALRSLRTLAPLNEPGFAPAHLWQAQYYFPARANAQRAKEIEKHLLHARAISPDDVTALRLLFQLYADTNRNEQALALLDEATTDDPWIRFRAAMVHQAEGRERESRKLAEDVASRFRAQHIDQLTIEDFGIWAEALTHLKRFPQADAILGIASRRFPQAQGLRPARARNCFEWASTIKIDSFEAVSKKLNLMDFALRFDPRDVKLVRQIERLTDKSGNAAAAARKNYSRLLAQGNAMGITHLVLGIMAHREVEPARARFHYQRAMGLKIPVPIALSYVSIVLADAEVPDEETAISLVKEAVELSPNSAIVRELRASVLGQLHQYEQAITDLEFVKQQQPERASELDRRIEALRMRVSEPGAETPSSSGENA